MPKHPGGPMTLAKTLMLLAAALGIVFSVLWQVLAHHEQRPHDGAITIQSFEQYEDLQKEFRANQARRADQILGHVVDTNRKLDRIYEILIHQKSDD